jgi:hypothetical protein
MAGLGLPTFVGFSEGALVGSSLGDPLLWSRPLGELVLGASDGLSESLWLGILVGASDGLAEGPWLGLLLGAQLGESLEYTLGVPPGV